MQKALGFCKKVHTVQNDKYLGGNFLHPLSAHVNSQKVLLTAAHPKI